MSASVQNGSRSDWNLRVDAQGKQTGSGAFVARSPVPYHGGTTVPRAGGDAVSALGEAIANKKLLDQAVFVASQTPYARSLLQYAYRANIGIEFDADALNARGAGALLDSNPHTSAVTLVLNPDTRPGKTGLALLRACTLSHELTHAMRNRKDFFYKDGHTLRSAIVTGNLQEGDARAGGARAYADFMVQRPGDPLNRWVPPTLRTALEDETESMRTIVKRALPGLARGNSAGFARSVAQDHCQGDLGHYHACTILWFTNVGRDYRLSGDKIGMKEFMTFDYATPATIADVMTIKGKPYLSDTSFTKTMGLCDTPSVRKAYSALQEEGDRYRAMGYDPQTEMRFKEVIPTLSIASRSVNSNLQAMLPAIAYRNLVAATP